MRRGTAWPVVVSLGTVRVSILTMWALTACQDASKSQAEAADAGGDAGSCARVVAKTEAGTCPVVPPTGVVCDLTDIASGWCSAPDCPSRSGCCGYGAHSGETCFLVCGDCGTVPRQTACVTQGSCTTDSDCQGSLPHICRNCPLSPNGQGSRGCAHWTCKAGQCEVDYCEQGLFCQAGRGCPAYYLPPIDRSCSAAADCALVDYHQNCCLTVKVAVRVDAQAHFAEVERQCASIQEPHECGCLGSEETEEGASPGAGQSFAADCVAGTCRAVIRGGLRCGAATCDPGQSCCVSSGDGGQCVYSCAASCPVVLDDAGASLTCRESP
jgi:hypothetical protein